MNPEAEKKYIQRKIKHSERMIDVYRQKIEDEKNLKAVNEQKLKQLNEKESE